MTSSCSFTARSTKLVLKKAQQLQNVPVWFHRDLNSPCLTELSFNCLTAKALDFKEWLFLAFSSCSSLVHTWWFKERKYNSPERQFNRTTTSFCQNSLMNVLKTETTSLLNATNLAPHRLTPTHHAGANVRHLLEKTHSSSLTTPAFQSLMLVRRQVGEIIQGVSRVCPFFFFYKDAPHLFSFSESLANRNLV